MFCIYPDSYSEVILSCNGNWTENIWILLKRILKRALFEFIHLKCNKSEITEQYPWSESKSPVSGFDSSISNGSDLTSSSGSPLSSNFKLYTMTSVPLPPFSLSNSFMNCDSVLNGEYLRIKSISCRCCNSIQYFHCNMWWWHACILMSKVNWNWKMNTPSFESEKLHANLCF